MHNQKTQNKPNEVAEVKNMISYWVGNHFYFHEPKEIITSPVVLGIIKNNYHLLKQVQIKK
jgi:hypothetical protein